MPGAGRRYNDVCAGLYSLKKPHAMRHAIQKHYKNANTFNTLFLPGLPGPYKERPLIADLTVLGSNVYTIVYPGTYDVRGEVSPHSMMQSIKAAVAELNTTGMPLLSIAYSFSTQYALQAAALVEDPLGFIFFSPTIDLRYDSVEDFYSVTARLNELDYIHVDAEKFTFAKTWNAAVASYYKKLDILSKRNVPTVFICGEKDPALRSDMIAQALEEYQRTRRSINIDVMNIPAAGHNIDELYGHEEAKSLVLSTVPRW